MDDKQRFLFHSCIALCDQAIAPLTQLERTLKGIITAEMGPAQDQADDVKLDKLTSIKHQIEQISGAAGMLDHLKTSIEKYK